MAGKPLIVILGATATGKTGLGIQIAQALNGEIISADSRQIYRHMNIGTAKATPTQQAQAQHHMIDVVKPDENMTLADFQEQAYAHINACHARGKLPLLVGGTGQYITAIVEGWSIPRVPPNPDLRAEFEAYAAQNGAEALHQRLKNVDAEAAAKIHPNNVRRIVRALEVYEETGTPISVLQRKKPPPYAISTIGLQLDRESLYERADKRVEAMIDAGFVQEVEDLLGMGYDRHLPSMSALGYREMVAHLLDDLPLTEAIQLTKFATHDFIRRQDIWFRGHDHGIVWHDSANLDADAIIKTLRG